MAGVASRGTWVPVDERARRGKAGRRASPRSSHGEWAPAADREDPIAILEGQATTRIADLVPIRYGRTWDGKGSVAVEEMNAEQLRIYGRVCGWTLSRAHARASDRVAIASYLGSGDRFDQAIGAFAIAYADQNELDFRALERAVDDGRLDARMGL